MVEEAGLRPWTDVFSRSRVCPAVFNLTGDEDDGGEAEVYGALHKYGLPGVQWSSMFSSSYWSTALLDGFVIGWEPYGFPAGGLAPGGRVVGYSAFRLLCHLLGLKAPRQLKGEPEVPAVDDLLRSFEEQVALPKADLEARAEKALGIGDSLGLRTFVYEEFGPDVQPLDDDLRRVILEPGPWGEAGFSIELAERYRAMGVALDEAVVWREEFGVTAFRLEEVLAPARTMGFRRLRAWAAAGIPTSPAVRIAATGMTLAEAKRYRSKGLNAWDVATWAELGWGPEQLEEFAAEGFTDFERHLLMIEGITPAAARKWIDAGAERAIYVSAFKHAGWTLKRLRSASVEDRRKAVRWVRGYSPDDFV